MKTIILISLVALIIAPTKVYSSESFSSSDVITQSFEKTSERQVVLDGDIYIERIYKADKPLELVSPIGSQKRYGEIAYYTLEKLNNNLPRKTYGNETVPLLSYSLSIRVNYDYTPFTYSSGTYYRLNTLGYTLVNIENTITLKNVYLEIANNGFGDSKITSGQQRLAHKGAVTSAGISGNPAWIPSVSYSTTSYLTATRFYVQLDVTRGTGAYSPSWSRSF